MNTCLMQLSMALFFVCIADGIYYLCDNWFVPHRRQLIQGSRPAAYASLSPRETIESNLFAADRGVIMLLLREHTNRGCIEAVI